MNTHTHTPKIIENERERRKIGLECHQFPDRGRQDRRLQSRTEVFTGTNNEIKGETASLLKASPLLDHTTVFRETNGLLWVTFIKSLHH